MISSRGDGSASAADTDRPIRNEIRTVRAGSTAIFIVRGELDFASSGEVLSELVRVLTEAPHDHLLIDLAEVTFMDAAGLGVLISAQRFAQGLGISSALVAPSAAALSLLRLTHLDASFAMHNSLQAALDHVTEHDQTHIEHSGA